LRILVTGGAGRLGAAVVRLLAERGHSTSVLDLPGADFSQVAKTPKATVLRGDISDSEALRTACDGVDVAVHLAAILPPHSERSLERTMLINATGTANLVKALESTTSAPVVFASSVCVYGRTHSESPPIAVSHPLSATDNYSMSKIAAEETIRASRLRHTILRISAVYAAEPFEFPSPLQFREDQRVEFIDREDAASALAAAAEGLAKGKTLNISGGASWRMTGGRFVSEILKALGVEAEVEYPKDYGYFDWYDTEESQRLLGYQRTPFSVFKERLAEAFAK
jgi:nucleoside-diphosphate-sugar epimerase